MQFRRAETAIVRDHEKSSEPVQAENGCDNGLNARLTASSPARCSHAIGGAAKITAQRKIFRSTTYARAADGETRSKRISLRFARTVTEPDIAIAKRDEANRQRNATNRSWLAVDRKAVS